MNSLPDAASLATLQSRFAAALRARDDGPVQAMADCIVDDGLAPAARVQLYRNNGRAMFEGALARTYPVLVRRVGDEYFSRLAIEYREAHPSRSGDLHWVGEPFPSWLARRMEGSEYAWLAELARLEWACEEALVAEVQPAAPADALARVAPEEVADAVLSLQPALRLVSSGFPVWSVWQVNQPGSAGDAVDPTLGAQHVAVIPDGEGLMLHALPLDQFTFLQQLAMGRTIEQALDASGLAIESLAETLAWLFGNGLVTSVRTAREPVTHPGPTRP